MDSESMDRIKIINNLSEAIQKVSPHNQMISFNVLLNANKNISYKQAENGKILMSTLNISNEQLLLLYNELLGQQHG